MQTKQSLFDDFLAVLSYLISNHGLSTGQSTIAMNHKPKHPIVIPSPHDIVLLCLLVMGKSACSEPICWDGQRWMQQRFVPSPSKPTIIHLIEQFLSVLIFFHPSSLTGIKQYTTDNSSMQRLICVEGWSQEIKKKIPFWQSTPISPVLDDGHHWLVKQYPQYETTIGIDSFILILLHRHHDSFRGLNPNNGIDAIILHHCIDDGTILASTKLMNEQVQSPHSITMIHHHQHHDEQSHYTQQVPSAWSKPWLPLFPMSIAIASSNGRQTNESA